MSDSLSSLVHNADLKGLKKALSDGADPNATSYGGETALHYAAERGFAPGIAALIAAGADPDVASEREDTPLITSVIHKEPDCTRALLEGGADPEKVNKLGSSPLNYAARMNAGKGVTMTQTVVVDGVEKEVPVDMGPRERAAMDVARVLLEKGANADSEDARGMTALHHAAGAGSAEWTTLLLEGGATPGHANADGYQAIHSASGSNHTAIVALLLEHGADPSATDTSGFSPLHDAAFGGNGALVELLLAKGADTSVKIKNGWDAMKEGMTPRDVAEAKGHAEVLALFDA